MDKLGLGLIMCVALAAGCTKPELGLGDLEGAGADAGVAGSTQGAQQGTGGKRTEDASGGSVQDGSGGKSPRAGSGGTVGESSGGKSVQGGSGGKVQQASGGKSPQGGSGGSAEPAGGDGGKGQIEPGCTALDESECSMSQSCSPIYGSDDGTFPPTVFDVFAGCQPSGTACPTITRFAHLAGSPDRCLVISGCLPEGWQEDAACSTQCCRDAVGQEPGTGGTGAGGSGSAGAKSSAGTGNAAGAGNDCALATPEELAATPRENENLEQLALAHSDGIVADQDVYDRVVRDVTRIREEAEDISSINYWPPNDGKTLLLVVDAATFGAMQSDSYTDWDCLLDSYPVTDITYEEHASLDMYTVLIELKGIYRLEPIAAQFAELPGVSSAEPNFGAGDGPTICLTPGDSVWHYVFDRAGGDCPAGCTTHSYTYFTVSSDGATIEHVGYWNAETSSSPAPDWVAQYASSEACR